MGVLVSEQDKRSSKIYNWVLRIWIWGTRYYSRTSIASLKRRKSNFTTTVCNFLIPGGLGIQTDMFSLGIRTKINIVWIPRPHPCSDTVTPLYPNQETEPTVYFIFTKNRTKWLLCLDIPIREGWECRPEGLGLAPHRTNSRYHWRSGCTSKRKKSNGGFVHKFCHANCG